MTGRELFHKKSKIFEEAKNPIGHFGNWFSSKSSVRMRASETEYMLLLVSFPDRKCDFNRITSKIDKVKVQNISSFGFSDNYFQWLYFEL